MVENLSDIQLVENDAIIALGAMSKYEGNADLLQVAMGKLIDAMPQN